MPWAAPDCIAFSSWSILPCLTRLDTAGVLTRISMAHTLPRPPFCRISCCETTPRSDVESMVRTCPCLSAGKAFTIRSTAAAAPLVCSVAITRMPISAAVIAVLIVSRSRSSPTRTTSGSSRRAECSALEKDGACTPTSRWLTRQFFRGWMNSIGSSIVRMWPFSRTLRSSIIAASVVDLPEPVLPVTRMRPLLTLHRLRTASGILSWSRVIACDGIALNTAPMPSRWRRTFTRKRARAPRL